MAQDKLLALVAAVLLAATAQAEMGRAEAWIEELPGKVSFALLLWRL